MTNKKVILRMPKVLESLSPGVMAYWRVDKKAIDPLAVTPAHQYANIPKLIEIETSHDGLPPFGL
jgi:hypothetical protein